MAYQLLPGQLNQ